MRALHEMKCEACRIGAPRVEGGEARKLLEEIPRWKIVMEEGVQKLERTFDFKGFPGAIRFVNRLAALAEEEGHHPVFLVEFRTVTVWWWTHKIRGLHRNDFVMAARTDRL